MKRLFSYMKDYKLESILGPLFKMLEASFELFVPLVVAGMVDVGIRRGDSGLYLENGRPSGAAGPHWPGLLPDSPVFCRKGGQRDQPHALRNDLFAHIGRLVLHGDTTQWEPPH